jgi:hypothetical protein
MKKVIIVTRNRHPITMLAGSGRVAMQKTRKKRIASIARISIMCDIAKNPRLLCTIHG